VYNRLPSWLAVTLTQEIDRNKKEEREDEPMNPKVRVFLGVLTALVMMLLTFALPRGGALRDAQLVQFPMTVGIWAIFVLLFVKLK
jgi:hypothetical protein